jgi:hypothetical protein
MFITYFQLKSNLITSDNNVKDATYLMYPGINTYEILGRFNDYLNQKNINISHYNYGNLKYSGVKPNQAMNQPYQLNINDIMAYS